MKAHSKKILSLVTSGLLFTSSLGFAENPLTTTDYLTGYEAPTEFTFQVGDQVFKGKEVEPLIVEGRSLVPFRTLFGALGADLDYDDASKRIDINLKDQEILLTIGSNIALVNGEPVQLQLPARVHNNSTYIPLRDVAKITGLELEYSSLQKKITVYDLDEFLESIDGNFTIYNQILKNTSTDQIDKTYQSQADINAGLELYDEGQTKKVSGQIKFDGLSKNLDLNGSFDLKVDLSSFEQDLSAFMSAEELKTLISSLSSKHSIIMDSKNSRVYIKSDALSSFLGVEKGAWLKFSGQSLAGLESAFQMMNSGYIKDLLSNPQDSSMAKILYETSKLQYEELANQGMADLLPSLYDQVDIAAKMSMVLMGDEGFVKEGTGYKLSLDKNGLKARMQKYLPEAAADLNLILDSVSKLDYSMSFSNIESKNITVDMALKGEIKSDTGNISFDFFSKSVGNENSKLTLDVNYPGKVKASLNMDVKAKETNQSLTLTPPAGAKVIDMD